MNKPTCSACGDGGKLTRGMCGKCYYGWKRYGDPLKRKIKRDTGTAEERFWKKVDKNGPIPSRCPHLGPCWCWTAGLTAKGYGAFGNGLTFGKSPKSTIHAHTFAYKLLVGPIPEGLEPDHLCKNKRCVNPAHLEPVPHGENIRRGDAPKTQRDRTHCPQGHPYAGDNLYIDPNAGSRNCRTCKRERARIARERRRAA